MYAIRPARPADLPAVVALVVRLQADPTHHVGYHGVTEAQVAEELTAFAPDWASGAVLAVDGDDRPCGVLSVDADPVVGRGWLHGPFVDIPADHPAARQCWHNAADELLEHAMAVSRLAGIGDLELYGHRLNRRLGDFAARHGFTTRGTSRVFTLTGSALRSALISAVDDADTARPLGADEEIRRRVIDLHERCFPNRSITGGQLVDGARGHTVVVATGATGLLGYAAGFVQQEELYVDYVAVDPEMRAAGTGRGLVRALLRKLAAEHGVRPQAAAVISLGNDASERMFTALGFDLHLELVGYRLTR
ncbi:GNAT family N-acetyltransferase [Actinokineospora xionganensis]|uniref:GNAT family N-acetyltransferase n=1 Tax=Actinokineospora xionganensis TaxID=2684470 RepID=A0ABR7LDF5_9PSEU|nr:GNAT family N-acetyltransferase [Actinokineospora xionganensis]MBC6450745.1 GNAT family N-acetyltransferase [Actinokineospora xionganensis]